MRQWSIVNDKLIDLGEVPYLGVPYDLIKSGKVETLPVDYDGWFPFMRFCYSFGDLGIVSGLFEALKKKYPKIKIAIPSNEYVENMFGMVLNQWSYDTKSSSLKNIDLVWGNNPHIDYRFNVGDFDIIFTDHDRSYTELVHDGDMIRSCDEPLVEQILRRFGFTNDDILNIDSKPKLYFTKEEVERNDTFIKSIVGDSKYGCLLFASRLEAYKGRWDDSSLFPIAKHYNGYPVFYFSEFELNHTEWGDYFPNAYDFSKYNLSIRDQIYIKRKAKFNISYQAGVTDASNGDGTDSHILCPHRTIRENVVRGAQYYFSDGRTVKI